MGKPGATKVTAVGARKATASEELEMRAGSGPDGGVGNGGGMSPLRRGLLKAC